MTKSKKISLMFAAIFPALGILMSSTRSIGGNVAEYEHATNLVLGIVTLILVGIWCKADASDRGIELSVWSFSLAVLIPLVGVPIYIFRTRTVGEAWRSLGKAAAFLIGVLFLFSVAEVAVYVART